MKRKCSESFCHCVHRWLTWLCNPFVCDWIRGMVGLVDRLPRVFLRNAGPIAHWHHSAATACQSQGQNSEQSKSDELHNVAGTNWEVEANCCRPGDEHWCFTRTGPASYILRWGGWKIWDYHNLHVPSCFLDIWTRRKGGLIW